MISEFDGSDDIPKYKNSSNISTNLGSNINLINNAKNCSTSTLVNSSDVKTSKAIVNGISQPCSDKKVVLINHEKNLNLSLEPNFDINMKNHEINVVNGENDDLPESVNYVGLSLKSDSNLMELVLQSKEEIKNDIVAINTLKLTQSRSNFNSNLGELDNELLQNRRCIDNESNLMQANEKSFTNHIGDSKSKGNVTKTSDCDADIKTKTSSSDDAKIYKCEISQNCLPSVSKTETIQDKQTNSKDPELLSSSESSQFNSSISEYLKDLQSKDSENIKTDTIDHNTEIKHDVITSLYNEIEKSGTSDHDVDPNIKLANITRNKVKNKSEEKTKAPEIEQIEFLSENVCRDNQCSTNAKDILKPLLSVPTTEAGNQINDNNYVKSLNEETVIDAVSVPIVFPSDGMTTKDEKSTSLEDVTQANDQKRNWGLKRSLSDAGSDRRRVKRLRTFLSKNKNTPFISQPNRKESSETNEIGGSSLTDCMKESFETSLETEGETNPNQLYLGLLNDVLADDKELIKEPDVVRSKLQRINRKELEDMIIDQLMNKLLYDHELGAQKELCRRLEHTLEAANKRAMRLTQEVESLKGIVTKVSTEHKKRKMIIVHPTKIKRSVGIQANKTYISQGFSAAFLPDSEVRIVTPTKYHKIKKAKESSSKPGRKPKPKPDLIKEELKSEKQERDYLGIRKNLEPKLNSLKEGYETATKDNSSKSYIKKSKYGRRLAVNGKEIKTEIKTEEIELSSPLASPVKIEENTQPNIPAPLPHISCSEEDIRLGRVPPNPTLKVHLKNKSIILSWNITTSYDETSILSYQLYSYEESKDLPSTDLWQKIGSVKALELPMACTLTQFKCGRTYHFAVRAMTKKGRLGPFSLPKSLRMPPK